MVRDSGPRQLIAEIGPRLYRYGVVRLGSALLSEEAVAETLCRLVERGPALDGPPAPVRGWCVRCMVNVCREMERRRPIAISIEHGAAGKRPRMIRFERQTIERDDTPRTNLVRAMHALSDRQREAVTLRILMGLTVAAAAEAMGCAQGTVRALTHQGLASLRARLRSALEIAG